MTDDLLVDRVSVAFDALPGATGVVVAGRWVYANPILEALLGKALAGTVAVEVVAPEDREPVASFYQGRQGVHATRWVHRDGHLLAVEVRTKELHIDGHSGLVVAATDLSTRELLFVSRERELRESESRYRSLFDGSPLPICMFDAETYRYVAVNQKMIDLYGYSRDEFFAMTIKDVKRPEDVPALVERVERATPGTQRHVGVVKHRCKDGRWIDVDVTSHHLEVGGRRYQLAIGVDVSDKRRVEAQLRQSQKMEAIGQLAGGVAHDFNNLLAVMLTTTSYVRGELGELHRLAGDLSEIELAADRAAALTRQLLAFSRKQPFSPRVMSLHSVVENLEKMLRRIVGEDIALVTRCATAGKIEADAGQIEQVVMNLVVNARDAMPKGGKLVIETSNVELDASNALYVGTAPGAYVMLMVADTGCGMDDETRSRIFEPFFTTKEVGYGTGLGLSTVFGIVKQSGGAITVESQPGVGATFRIYFPRVDAAPVVASTPSKAQLQRGSESILVVEDDPQLRAVIHRRLRSLGYRTLEAHDAISAIEMMKLAGSIDLLLTDLVMPGLDGRALASHLLRDHPTLKILFMSGYSEHAAVKTAALGPADHFIAKPFTSSDLSIAVRRTLDNDSRTP